MNFKTLLETSCSFTESGCWGIPVGKPLLLDVLSGEALQTGRR